MPRIAAVLAVALAACGSSDPPRAIAVDDDGLPDRHFTVVLGERAREAAERDRTQAETARALQALADAHAQVDALTRTFGDSGTTTIDAVNRAIAFADRAEANARLGDRRRYRQELMRMRARERLMFGAAGSGSTIRLY